MEKEYIISDKVKILILEKGDSYTLDKNTTLTWEPEDIGIAILNPNPCFTSKASFFKTFGQMYHVFERYAIEISDEKWKDIKDWIGRCLDEYSA